MHTLIGAHEAIVRRNSVEALRRYVDEDMLRDIYTEQTDRQWKGKSKLKLARMVKQNFVNDYRNCKLPTLLKNIEVFDTINCVTFQHTDVWDELVRHGTYIPSERYASEPETTEIIKEELGYYPVWLINPLILGQCHVDKDAFTILPFMNYLTTAFPIHRYNVGEDFVLLEFKFRREEITEANSSALCTCLPKLKSRDLVGVYKFYINDREAPYRNTAKYPYIKVLKLYGANVMCMQDYDSATAYGGWTGTEYDFE